MLVDKVEGRGSRGSRGFSRYPNSRPPNIVTCILVQCWLNEAFSKYIRIGGLYKPNRYY